MRVCARVCACVARVCVCVRVVRCRTRWRVVRGSTRHREAHSRTCPLVETSTQRVAMPGLSNPNSTTASVMGTSSEELAICAPVPTGTKLVSVGGGLMPLGSK